MITLVAVLVEKSRIDRQLQLSVRDMQALIGGGKVRYAANSIHCIREREREVVADGVRALILANKIYFVRDTGQELEVDGHVVQPSAFFGVVS